MPTLLYNIFMAKRITWIINDATQVGGIERVICNLSNYFIDNNYKVKIISLNTTSGKAYFNLSSQVAIQHLGYPVENNLKRKKLKSVLGDVIEKENATSDIIITCHPWIAMPILQQKKRFKGKVISMEHAAWEYYGKKRRILNVAYYRRADKLIVLTDYTRKIYQKYGLKNVVVIPNIITEYPDKLAPLTNQELIAAGRLTEVKGFDRLIYAIDLIKKDFDSWHVTIYGDGEDREALCNLIKERQLDHLITIAHFTDHLQEKILNCSGFIVSSHSEAYPMVVLEAISSGVPVIGFNIPALREMDQGKNVIILASQDNIEELADKIKNYIKSSDRRKLGIAARELSQDLSLEKIGPIWIKMIDML